MRIDKEYHTLKIKVMKKNVVEKPQEEKKEYPQAVKARLQIGWKVVSETESSILLGSTLCRMNYDKTTEQFSKPWTVYLSD